MVDIANTILGKIVDRKQEEFAARLKQRSYKDVEELAQAATPVRGFAQSLQHKRPGVIAEIKKASHLATPPDAIAVFYQTQQDFTQTDLSHKLNLILDGVQDPGNLGTIIRIADWFGIENILCSYDTADVYNTKTVQATMRALSRVSIHYTNIIDLLTHYSNLAIYGTFLDGENIYTEPLTSEGFIVMGNEGKGIRPEIEKMITNRLYIPNFSTNNTTSESLNVAVATAVVCSEFRRR